MLARGRYFQLLLALLFIAFIVYQMKPAELWREVRDVNLIYLAPAIALNLPIALITPLRSSIILKRLGFRLYERFLIPATIVGFVLGSLTPAASGEVVRASAMRGAGVPLETGLSLVVFERLMAAYLLVLTSLAALAVAHSSAPIAGIAVAAALVLAALPWLGARLLPVLSPDAGSSVPSLPGRGLRALLAMAARIRLICADFAMLFGWIACSAGILALIALQYYLAVRSIGQQIEYSEAWAAFGISAVVAIVSLLPFGIGAGDGSLAAVLERFGLTLEQGAAAAIMVRASVTLPLICIALIAQLFLHRDQANRPAGEPVPTAKDELAEQ